MTMKDGELGHAGTLQSRNDEAPPSLLDLVGRISDEDLQLMRDAIEEESERVG